MSTTSEVSFCWQHDRHGDCPHQMAASWSLLRKPRARVVLCGCACHSICPLHNEVDVPEQVWVDACVCSGSAASRATRARIAAESDEQARRAREVMDGIVLGRGRSAAEIEQMMVDGYTARGWEAPKGFAWATRIMAASTAGRGRARRLVSEAARAVRAAKRVVEDPDIPDGGGESRDRDEPGR